MSVWDKKGREKLNTETKLVDENEVQTGIDDNPLVTEDIGKHLDAERLKEQKLTNLYLSILVGTTYTTKDAENRD